MDGLFHTPGAKMNKKHVKLFDYSLYLQKKVFLHAVSLSASSHSRRSGIGSKSVIYSTMKHIRPKGTRRSSNKVLYTHRD